MTLTEASIKSLVGGLLSYSLETGDVWWNVARSNAVKVGAPIKQPKSNKNYIQVRIDRKLLLAHRIIWEHFNGPIPEDKEINHINGVKSDNKLENLELVSHKENVRHAKRTGLTPRVTTEEYSIVGHHKTSGSGLFFRSLKEAKQFGFHNISVCLRNSSRTDKKYYWERL